MVQRPLEPRAKKLPSHRPAKNTAFSSCGSSYTASIFSGSSGQNVATSRDPVGLSRGVTVRQMNLGGGRGHRKPYLQSLCSCNHTCLPNPIHKHPRQVLGWVAGRQGQRKGGQGLENEQSPLSKTPEQRSNHFAPPPAPSSRKPSLTTSLSILCSPPSESLKTGNTKGL